MLESLKHGDSSFITLTYSDENLPPQGSLQPKDVQDWLKKLRARISPLKIRYYLVGEYGDRSWRPHYHVALFGFRSCLRGRTEHREDTCCGQCEVVRTTWGKGGVDLGELNAHTAQYVSGYVTKKLTRKDDERLKGRYPEFARMSLRPGIGALAVEEIADALTSEHGPTLLERQGDVPTVLKHGSRAMPLGKYLRRKIRDYVIPGKEAQAEVKEKNLALYAQKMRELFQTTTTEIRLSRRDQLARNQEARYRLKKKKGDL